MKEQGLSILNFFALSLSATFHGGVILLLYFSIPKPLPISKMNENFVRISITTNKKLTVGSNSKFPVAEMRKPPPAKKKLNQAKRIRAKAKVTRHKTHKIAPSAELASMQTDELAKPSTRDKALSSNDSSQVIVEEQAVASYSEALRAFILEHRVYPSHARRMRQQGLVEVQFTVLANGDIREVAIKKTSGFKLIDQASVKLLNRLKTFRPLPAGLVSRSFVVPIHYKLR